MGGGEGGGIVGYCMVVGGCGRCGRRVVVVGCWGRRRRGGWEGGVGGVEDRGGVCLVCGCLWEERKRREREREEKGGGRAIGWMYMWYGGSWYGCVRDGWLMW